ncbi:MAG: hypothetical protein DRP96_06125 [Candidatus Neomarinimicrobiota bacterium]|nr:MAG: hypothetical protein DRP96_06125 [Candidatus Neomarinimicrobiota bacterium]
MNKRYKGEEKMINMYGIVPRPCVLSETDSDGKIVLLKPKFKSAFTLKFLAPLSRHKDYKIHLDEVGSAIWKRIDGKMNTGKIAEEISREFGDNVDPVFERVGTFIQQLKYAKLIEY